MRSASTASDIRELSLAALRQAVATAFEDPTLFSMSVAENLALGRASTNPATDEQLAQAIEIAAAQFVYDLPFGLDTRIGEQGMSLSGGQRQRLSLARAILAAPKILVLDDTLSALDMHTEAVVEEALRRVLHHVTGIVVAHRASTVLLADKVALLQRRHDHAHRHARRAAGQRAAVPLPAGRRRRTRRRCRAQHARGRTTRRWSGWTQATRTARRPKPPADPTSEYATIGGRAADDRNRHATGRRPRGRLARPGQGRARATTCPSTKACRAAARPVRCSARCCGPTV